ncbi:MAG: hypothetical protein ACI3XA_04075 [Clostridia bacterium]
MKKWQKIIVAVIVIFGVIVCVKSCSDKKEADIILAYIGSDFVDYNAFDENSASLEEVCIDVNGDGEKIVEVMEISFNNSLNQADLQNSSQKMARAVGAGVARVYLLEESFVINNASKGVFCDLSALGDGFKNSDGEVVAINVEGNKKVEKMGINTKNLYMAVRIVSEIDTVSDKNIDLKHQCAMNIAKYILS